MAIPMGSAIVGSNTEVRRTPLTVVGVAAVQVLRGDRGRVAFRIYAAAYNWDNIFMGYDTGVTVLNSLDVCGPGEMLEDSGYDTCYKGPIYLISGTATQYVIVEEVVTRGGR